MTGGAKRILIVDDEPDSVEGAVAMLEAAGYSVSSASDGAAGLAAARKETPDLVLLDVQMPGKSGFETFVELRRDDAMREVPVVFLTGVAARTGVRFSARDVGDFLGSEPEGYLEKPVDERRLLRTVEKILGTQRR